MNFTVLLTTAGPDNLVRIHANVAIRVYFIVYLISNLLYDRKHHNRDEYGSVHYVNNLWRWHRSKPDDRSRTLPSAKTEFRQIVIA